MTQSEHLLHLAGETSNSPGLPPDFWSTYGVDVSSFALSVLLLVAYYAYVAYRTRRNPTFTVQAVNMIARAEWVDSIMRDPGKEVLAVQTLRNSTMAATFLASTSVLLIVGVLTLSAQGDKMEGTWHTLNIVGSARTELWLVKLLIMLLDLLVAFFSFSMAVRVFNHVGYMINVPLKRGHRMLQPEHVATHLNRAGTFYSIGMRAYYFCVPMVFWLFGPHLMLLATVALIIALYRLDRAPTAVAEDFSAEANFLARHDSGHHAAS
ncbi:MAG TPA: DUF599 domain-containing protein [Gallionellaceae bacterium]|nr:DUF599 domain-containing protein [Gallionellaceae bacterium]